MPSLDSIITFSTLAALVQFGIIISVILRVMLTRHPPGSAFAWILITTLLPYFGFILYLLFGERPIGQLRATRFRKHLAHLIRSSRARSSLLRGRCRATSPDTARSYIWRPAWGTFP